MAAFAYINPNGQIPTTNLVLQPLKPGWVLDSPLTWSAWITYSDHSRNDQSPIFSGHSDVWSPITIDFQGICMGNVIHMSVKAVVRDVATGAKDNISWDGHNSILGQNPSVSDVKSRLGNIKTQVIAYKESSPKWKQFGADGLPVVDVMLGFGIMQLTNSPKPTPTEIWNWKDNVDAGIKKYNDGITVVQNHYNNLRTSHPTLPALSAADLQKAYYQYYNSGNNFYWLPNSANDGWIKNPNSQFYVYGDDAVDIESRVNAGNPPAGW